MPEIQPVNPNEPAPIELQNFDFTDLPQIMQERVVGFLSLETWQAFMLTSKYNLELAFHHEYLCGILLSVLLNVDLLEAISFESLLNRFRASPGYGELVNKVKNSPKSLDSGEWMAYIQSATSIDQLKAIPYEICVDLLVGDFKEFNDDLAVAEQNAETGINKQQVEILSGFLSSAINLLTFHRGVSTPALEVAINENYLASRARESKSSADDAFKFTKIITLLRSLPHDPRFANSLEEMILESVRSLMNFNQTQVHDHPLPRLSMLGLSLGESDLQQLDFSHANMQRVNFRGGSALNMSCCYANAQHANLSRMQLGKTNFYSTDLRWANLRFSFLLASVLTRANLSYAKMKGAYLAAANLEGAIIIDADLRAADFTFSNLVRTNLSMCNLQKARFFGSVMNDTILHAADMQGALFIKANLTNSDLTGANLSRAELVEVNLTGANLFGVNWQDAKIDKVNLTNAKVLGMTEAHLTDIDLLQARLDLVFQAMQDKQIPRKLHSDYRINAANELVACVELYPGMSAQDKIAYLEAVIQHPIFSAQHMSKTKKALNHAVGLFSANKVAMKSASQQVIADCLKRLHEGVDNRPKVG